MNVSVEAAMLLPLFIAIGAFLGGAAYDLSLRMSRDRRRG